MPLDEAVKRVVRTQPITPDVAETLALILELDERKFYPQYATLQGEQHKIKEV